MDSTKVKLGHCIATFKGVALGHTKGGETVTYTPVFHDVTVDKYGQSVVEKRLIGEKLVVEVALAEYSIANLGVAMPAGTAGASKITLGSSAGVGLKALAGLLVLHPVDNEEADLSEDVNLYKAAVTSAVPLDYKVDSERLIKVTFEAMIDESKSDGNYLGLIGDSTT